MPSWGPDLVNKLILFYSILYNNLFFFPNRLVETSGDCEWTDNIEYTRHRMKTNNTDT